MGKVRSGWLGGDDEDPDEKKSRLRRELEQIRKNALGRKRDLRNKDSIVHKPKSGLMRTLNQFASQRRKIEDATQISNLINKPRIIKQEVIQPRDLRGFFAAGIKGREITRPDPAYQKYKNAVLQSDPLQLLQSATFCYRSEEKPGPSKTMKSPIEDDHEELQIEVSKILNNCHSSDSNSFDLDNPGPIEFPSSPVIGRYKGVKKKANQVKPAANEVRKNLHPQEKEVPFVNNVQKGERFRRRLFDEEIGGVNNKRNEIPNNELCNNNELSRHSTPENVIFYSEVVSKQPVNKNEKRSNIDHLCADSDVINYYVKICKYFGQNDLKNMFRDKYEDPEQKAKESLKLTYKRTLKYYAQRQNCQPKSNDQTTPSSHSEVLLEPDSHIARVVKKNVAFMKQKQTSASNSTDSTKNFVSKVDAQIHYPPIVNTVDDNIAKRKRVPSSKGSEPELPSSTRAMADPKSVRVDSKMNMINPYRQEIVARYLIDQKNFSSEASQPQHHMFKEKIYNSRNNEEAYLERKSTKYVPAILRKNRSLADCVAKEKATILGLEKYPSQRNHQPSMLEFDLDNIESEHTPNSVIEPLLEAPKCKYVHANAKYNQPSRINIPIVQDNRHHRNARRAPSPSNFEKNFTLSQTYNLSPIQPSYANFHPCQLSQQSQASDNGNCGMTRMVSFGEIQDRTNRLTICSQNQQCSQEAMDHAYASQRGHHHQPRVAFPESAPCFNGQSRECEYHHQHLAQQSFCECSSGCNCCRAEQPMQSCNLPVCQPVKYHAAEGQRRQPIYQPGGESCSFAHKQPCCSNSNAAAATRGESSDFEYLDAMKAGYNDRPQSFAVAAPPNGNQRYVVQRQMQPASPPPMPPAVYQQVVHRHGHCAASDAYKMNDALLHQLTRQMHPKRQ